MKNCTIKELSFLLRGEESSNVNSVITYHGSMRHRPERRIQSDTTGIITSILAMSGVWHTEVWSLDSPTFTPSHAFDTLRQQCAPNFVAVCAFLFQQKTAL